MRATIKSYTSCNVSYTLNANICWNNVTLTSLLLVVWKELGALVGVWCLIGTSFWCGGMSTQSLSWLKFKIIVLKFDQVS